MSLFYLMTLCHFLLGLLSSGVLIPRSLLTSWLRFIISFFRISCHSIWSISHLHTIPIEGCAFLYAFAPMSFPHLFICSLVEVHRSSYSAHALSFPVFIHRILLHLGLEVFPAFKSVHIIAPIGATFLRQRAAQPSSQAQARVLDCLDRLIARGEQMYAMLDSHVQHTMDQFAYIQG